MKDSVGNGLVSWFHCDIMADFGEEVRSDIFDLIVSGGRISSVAAYHGMIYVAW